MTVRSGDILRTYDLDSVYLWRWREAGIIHPEDPGYGRAGGQVWPDWTMRMVALIRSRRLDGRHTCHSAARTPMMLLREVSDLLAADPDLPFVVIGDDGTPRPASTAEEVVAIVRAQRILTTVVAIPTFEEALSP